VTLSDRVALFLPALTAGGAERVMLTLGRALLSKGFAVDVVVARAVGGYLSDVPPGARLIDLRARRTMLSMPALVRYLRRERPRVLLSALDHANVMAVLAARLARSGTRTVVSAHSTPSLMTKVLPAGQRRMELLMLRLSHRFADGVVAVSHGVADDLSRTLGVPRDRITVIYNPVVTPELRQAASDPVPHPWFRPCEPPVILGVGRLATEKDYATLIRAFALLRHQRPVRLMILGEGPERSQLERLVAELGVSEYVTLPGFVPLPYAYIARAAVLALSSLTEGLPTVLIESLALGTPVVSTDCESGPREVLQHGRLGRLVPVGDAQGMAREIASVLSLPRPVVRDDAWRPFSIQTAVDAYVRALGVTANG